MKKLKATFKTPITAVVILNDDEAKDYIDITVMMNEAKKQCFNGMKKQLHERIEILSLDDFKFEIEEINTN